MGRQNEDEREHDEHDGSQAPEALLDSMTSSTLQPPVAAPGPSSGETATQPRDEGGETRPGFDGGGAVTSTASMTAEMAGQVVLHASSAAVALAPTIFPTPIANLVTAIATSARLSLRVTAFFIEAILETSQNSTRLGLGLTRRLLIGAISSARRVYLTASGDGE